MKVLWVEDQPADYREYWSILQDHGDQVVVATTVDQALSFLQSDVFEVIILDIAIPLGDSPTVADLEDTDFNGRYVIDWIRRESVHEVSRIVCLSNFIAVAGQLTEGLPVQVLHKAAFLNEFEELIYG
jgi:CheY-like chemotaxis protein